MIMIPKWLADLGLRINRLYYKRLYQRVYLGAETSPAWFDHRIDLYYHWPHNLFWLERGILPRKHMSEGCIVLDLFCGDGFYSRYFYSTIAGHIDAIDKDPGAIAHAIRWHSHPSINYVVADATERHCPRSRYDVIVWFEGIEHLNKADYLGVADRIKSAIGEKGILVGSTPIVPTQQLGEGSWDHRNEFTSTAELHGFLGRHFSNIRIGVTVYPVFGGGERRTAHFAVRGPKCTR